MRKHLPTLFALFFLIGSLTMMGQSPLGNDMMLMPESASAKHSSLAVVPAPTSSKVLKLADDAKFTPTWKMSPVSKTETKEARQVLLPMSANTQMTTNPSLRSASSTKTPVMMAQPMSYRQPVLVTPHETCSGKENKTMPALQQQSPKRGLSVVSGLKPIGGNVLLRSATDTVIGGSGDGGENSDSTYTESGDSIFTENGDSIFAEERDTIIQEEEIWEDLGMATYREAVLAHYMGTPYITKYQVPLQQSSTRPGVYRLVNPYGEYYPFNASQTYDKENDHYMVIHAEDPNAVWIESCQTGMTWDYEGAFTISSYVAYLMERNGYELDSLKSMISPGCFGKLENGLLTMPYQSMVATWPGFIDSWYVLNLYELFCIAFPGVDMIDQWADLSWEYHEDNVSVWFNLGEDVDHVNVALVPVEMVDSDIFDKVKNKEVEGVQTIYSAQERLTFSEADYLYGSYTIIAVAIGENYTQPMQSSTVDFYPPMSETWNLVANGVYADSLLFGISHECLLYQNEGDTTMYRIANGINTGSGGCDILFRKRHDGSLSVESGVTDYYHPSYEEYIQYEDWGNSYYDANSRTFVFHLNYFISLGYFGDYTTTYTITSAITEDEIWEDMGMAWYRDNIVSSVLGVEYTKAYQVPLQRNIAVPGVYRLVNPYGEAFPLNEGKEYDANKEHYMVIHAEDPEMVWIETCETGMTWEYGNNLTISSVPGYYLDLGYTLEEVKELYGYYFGYLSDGRLHMYHNSLVAHWPGAYANDGWYYSNVDNLFHLSFPEVDFSDRYIRMYYDVNGDTIISRTYIGADVDSALVAMVPTEDRYRDYYISEQVIAGKYQTTETVTNTGDSVSFLYSELRGASFYLLGCAMGDNGYLEPYYSAQIPEVSNNWNVIAEGMYDQTFMTESAQYLLYQNEDNPSFYCIKNWKDAGNGGTDFIFRQMDNGECFVFFSQTGKSADGVTYLYQDFDQCFYDEVSKLYNFNLEFYRNAYDSIIYNVTESFTITSAITEDDLWEDFGMATYRDNMVSTFFGLDKVTTWQVPMQKHTRTPGLYRLVNPYGAAYPLNEGKNYDENEKHYMIIHAEDSDFVWIEHEETGMCWDYDGNFAFRSMVEWNINVLGSTLADMKAQQPEYFGRMADGLITMPESIGSMLVHWPGASYSNSWFYSNMEGLFAIALPGKEFQDQYLKTIVHNDGDSISLTAYIGKDVEAAYVALIPEEEANEENLYEQVVSGQYNDVQMITVSGVTVKFNYNELPYGSYYLVICANGKDYQEYYVTSYNKYAEMNDVWNPVAEGDYNFGLFDGTIMAYTLYQNGGDESMYCIPDWLDTGNGGSAFMFRQKKNGVCQVQPGTTGYFHESYGEYIQYEDYGSSFDVASGTYTFNLNYFISVGSFGVLTDTYILKQDSVVTEEWEDMGMATYRDNLVSTFLGAEYVTTYEVPMQRSLTTPGLYRLVNPYGEAYPYNEGKQYSDSTHYMVIHAENPEKVWIETSETAMNWGYAGNFTFSSMVAWDLEYNQIPWAEIPQDHFGRMENGIITMPAYGGMIAAWEGFLAQNAWYLSNMEGLFAVALPGVEFLDQYLKTSTFMQGDSICTYVYMGTDVDSVYVALLSQEQLADTTVYTKLMTGQFEGLTIVKTCGEMVSYPYSTLPYGTYYVVSCAVGKDNYFELRSSEAIDKYPIAGGDWTTVAEGDYSFALFEATLSCTLYRNTQDTTMYCIKNWLNTGDGGTDFMFRMRGDGSCEVMADTTACYHSAYEEYICYRDAGVSYYDKESDAFVFTLEYYISAGSFGFFTDIFSITKRMTTGLDNLVRKEDDLPAFNLWGLPVGDDFEGVVIKNGKKHLKLNR